MAKKATQETIGQRIRRLRNDRELGLTELADRAGISKGYLSSLETDSGDTKRPSGRTLLKLADAMGVTINDLLGRRWITETPNDLPEGLGEFAREAGLTEAEVGMLANIKFRGEQPQSKERWAVIYSAIRGSAYLDETSANRGGD